MLVGAFDLTLDSSGRVTLPPLFRSVMDAGMTVTRGVDRCLQVFPRQVWLALARRVDALPLFVDAARHARSLLFAMAAELVPDAAGAVVLPTPLLAYANITTRIVLVGMGTFAEIWSPEAWQAANEQLLTAVGRWEGAALPSVVAAI